MVEKSNENELVIFCLSTHVHTHTQMTYIFSFDFKMSCNKAPVTTNYIAVEWPKHTHTALNTKFFRKLLNHKIYFKIIVKCYANVRARKFRIVARISLIYFHCLSKRKEFKANVFKVLHRMLTKQYFNMEFQKLVI